MANLNYVLASIEKYFKNQTGINAFVYTDSMIDISQTVTVGVKTNLVGTETNFIIINKDYGVDYTGQDLINKYVSFNGVYKRITNYNSTTGEITIESQFNVPILTTDNLIIEVLDSIFIKLLNIGSSNSRLRFNKQNVRMILDIKTKFDSSKSKIFTLLENCENKLKKDYLHIKMYNGSTQIGIINIDDNLNSSELANSDNNLQRYGLSFLCNYRVNFLT